MLQRSPFPPLRPTPIAVVAGLLFAASLPLPAASLQPTHAGLVRQSLGARAAGFSYVEDDGGVHDLVRQGQLVAMRGNEDYFIDDDVRHAAARPEVKVFVERLSAQYRGACGEKLVVTSLVRPRSRQPWNSDPLSVHPTGMAVDLRISPRTACRRWLERGLLDLEEEGLVEAARERVVPHYHVVVFPAYADHLERQGIALPELGGVQLATIRLGPLGLPALLAPMAAASLPVAAVPVAMTAGTQTEAQGAAPTVSAGSGTTTASPPAAGHTNAGKHRSAAITRYKVRSGDTLWTIARRHGVTLAALRRSNGVQSKLRPGQVLAIPAR